MAAAPLRKDHQKSTLLLQHVWLQRERPGWRATDYSSQLVYRTYQSSEVPNISLRLKITTEMMEHFLTSKQRTK